MEHLLIVAFVAAIVTTVSAADLYANRITGLDTSRGRQYTVTYTSSIRPLVLWGKANQHIYYENDPGVDMSSIYTNGQGESTIIKPGTGEGIMFAMLVNDSFIYYYFQDFLGDKELPEVELECLIGDVVNYVENVPITSRIRYSNLPTGYSPGQFFYFYKYIASRDNPVLQTATSFHPTVPGVIEEPNITSTGGYSSISVDVNMFSTEGIDLGMLYYTGPNVAIFKGIAIAVKQAQHDSPFPDGFIGLSVSNMASNYPECSESVCTFYCDAYGNDIVDVQVRRKDDGEVAEPLFKFENEWYVTSGYERPAEDYGQTFVCSATNADGQTAEIDIIMQNEH